MYHQLTPDLMKLKFLFSFLLLCLIFSCDKDPSGNGNCFVSDELTNMYQDDVYRLLFREIYYDSLHPDRHSPEFNEQKVEGLLQAFQAVYNLSSIYRDTVVEHYQIHTFPDLGLYSISLKVDPQAEEIINLIEGNPTNDPVLDEIINTYAFTEIKTSLFYPDFNWITIISEKPWNLIPIWEELETLDYIEIAAMGGGAAGDGNNILLQRTGSGIIYDFSIGWGDCPSGCISRRHWIFEVNNNCSAKFLNAITD